VQQKFKVTLSHEAHIGYIWILVWSSPFSHYVIFLLFVFLCNFFLLLCKNILLYSLIRKILNRVICKFLNYELRNQKKDLMLNYEGDLGG